MKKLGIVLCVFALMACTPANKKIDKEAMQNIINSTVVVTNKEAVLYKANGEDMVEVGKVGNATNLQIDPITDKENPFVKIAGDDLYLNHKDLLPSNAPTDTRFRDRYVAQAFDIKTKAQFVLERENEKIELNEARVLPTYMVYEDHYMVDYQNKLWNLNTSYVDSQVAKAAPTNVATYIPVFMYHFFYDELAGEQPEDGNFMEIHRFESHVQYAKQNGFQAVTMRELEAHMQGHLQLKKGSFLITMDDNAPSVKRLAYPMLERNETFATNFVISSWTSEFEALKSPYVETQSHTDNMHRGGCQEQHGGAMLCAPIEEVVSDLTTSSNKLYGAFAIAYPFGDSNENAKNALRQAGYTLAFTVQPGYVEKGDDMLELPRVRVSTETTVEVFAAKLAPALQ